MIYQTLQRVFGAASALLSPADLIDRLLDHIDKLSPALMPAQVDRLHFKPVRIEVRRD